jgi:nicotinamide mononucleotide (NMN) deamidase PncC
MTREQQARLILERAKTRDLTIVTAESCTAGAIATTLSKRRVPAIICTAVL